MSALLVNTIIRDLIQSMFSVNSDPWPIRIRVYDDTRPGISPARILMGSICISDRPSSLYPGARPSSEGYTFKDTTCLRNGTFHSYVSRHFTPRRLISTRLRYRSLDSCVFIITRLRYWSPRVALWVTAILRDWSLHGSVTGHYAPTILFIALALLFIALALLVITSLRYCSLHGYVLVITS